jgi:hypothetical protein
MFDYDVSPNSQTNQSREQQNFTSEVNKLKMQEPVKVKETMET